MELDKGHRSGKDIVRVVALGRTECAPFFSNPNVRFQINQIEDFKAFHALVYYNIHGLWANSMER